MKTVREFLCCGGFVAAMAGLAGWDWRLAAVVGGVSVLACGLYMVWRNAQ